MELLLGDRLKKLLDELKLSQTQFAEIVGISKNATTSIVKNRSLPRADILQRFLKANPNVNANWLMTGNGSMFLKKQLFETITDMVNNSDLKEIRIIHAEDRSAYKNLHWQETFINDQPVEYRNISKLGVYRKFEMYDDSMDDDDSILPEGSLLLCRKLEQNLWGRLQRGDIFVFVGNDFNYKIRQVKGQDANKVYLHAFNDYFDDADLDLNTVTEIWYFMERSIKRSNLDYKLKQRV
ncbi:MAG: helix-turn-helix domain-containing protein [Bacteroidetes bacterium]|nr:helix-turn-helix domain-containing protein [Bacteroidota bacterium]